MRFGRPGVGIGFFMISWNSSLSSTGKHLKGMRPPRKAFFRASRFLGRRQLYHLCAKAIPYLPDFSITIHWERSLALYSRYNVKDRFFSPIMTSWLLIRLLKSHLLPITKSHFTSQNKEPGVLMQRSFNAPNCSGWNMLTISILDCFTCRKVDCPSRWLHNFSLIGVLRCAHGSLSKPF